MRQKLRLTIERKPPPQPLAPFICAICESETARDPYTPDFERPPVCFGCIMSAPRRTQLHGVDVERWRHFKTAHALLCAIEQEVTRVQQHQ